MKKLLNQILIGSVVAATVAAFVQKRRGGSILHPLSPSTDNPVSSIADLPSWRWKQALKETKSALTNKDLPSLSAALAYYGTLAFFPTLVAFISIYSLVISPEQLASTITAAEQYLPKDLATVVSSQLTKLTERPTANLVAAFVSISLALFASSGGVQNLIKATNKAYDVAETRGFIKLRLVSLAFTVAGILVTLPTLSLLVMRSDILTSFGVPESLAVVVSVVRWLLIIAIISIALAAVYRYGPNRKDPKWEWVSWGAAAATLIWAAGSALFFFYLQNFANYQQSYGVFAGIIALMLWFNLSGFIILLGAEVNHRLEDQTKANAADNK